jgi:hypothetical protein
MKKILAGALLLGLPFAVLADVNTDAYNAEAKKITGAFFEELKGALGKGIKEGGPVSAVEVCNVQAPGIAMKHSQSSGWDVGRTSLKLRNPGNAPDAWEIQVLNDFEKRRASGEGPDTLAYSEVVQEDGQEYFRFMKAIVMPPADKMPCLMCHGGNIDPTLAAKLDELYPQDKARGYEAGQVRGAFTLKKKL